MGMEITTTAQNEPRIRDLVVAGVALVTVLAAQFPMDGLADGSLIFHWLQHGMLFAGGLVFGAAILNLHRSAQRRV